MTPERLAEIRARAEAATEGPWGRHPAPKGRGQRVTNKDGATLFVNERPGQMRARVDATFIAAARTDVPELVAEVERLTNDLAVTEAQAIDRDEAATILAQQVEKVRALHQPWDDGPQPYCTHDREPWPCPTEQALGGP